MRWTLTETGHQKANRNHRNHTDLTMTTPNCTYHHPSLLPCAYCHEGCAYFTVETTPEPACGTQGYIPCMSCREGCPHRERFVVYQQAMYRGRWPDGSPFADPPYYDDGVYVEEEPEEPEREPEAVKLNADQEAVVAHVNGPALVIAGAGSGKTRAVTHRIAHLIGKHCDASEILAVTFTRKAAREMKERLEHMVGERQASRCTMATFHALAAKICRDHAKRLHRNPGFSIWTDDSMKRESRRIVKGRFGSKTKETDALTSADLLTIIGDRKRDDGSLTCPKWKAEINRTHGKYAYELVHEYESLKRASNAMDFDDLIYHAVRILRDPQIQQVYLERWRFVMVDEYQDTNDLQERFLRLLVGPEDNLLVVGDEDQAIYGFRGANVRHIMTFTERWPGAKVYTLGQNYRSTPNIVDAASRVIVHNEVRRDKQIWSEAREGKDVQYIVRNDAIQEASWIASQIQASEEDGVPLEEHAVLVRTRRQLTALQTALTHQGVLHHTVGSTEIWDRADVRMITAWFRAYLNPQDVNAGIEMLSRWPGLGAKTVELWRTKSKDWKSMFDRMDSLHKERGLGEHTMRGKSIARFTESWEAFGKAIRGAASIRSLVQDVYEWTGLVQEILKEKQSENKKLAANGVSRDDLRKSLLEVVPDEPTTYQDVRDWVDTISLNAAKDKEGGATLSTIHGSKGLEWHTVWVAGCSEGLLPFGSSVEGKAVPVKDDHVQEERRLMYVAMTRAKKRLILSRHENVLSIENNGARSVAAKASRFLAESAPQAKRIVIG